LRLRECSTLSDRRRKRDANPQPLNQRKSAQSSSPEECMPIKITIKPNGPYRVEGNLEELELLDPNGTKYDLTGKPGISLCRCGGSTNKPFCDGTHSKIGFQAAEAAVRAEQKP
jgi:CDGSH-type Zn-finger protein